ncbi:MAG: tetratricopeptide repeat protein [Chloroflexota bacterium]|nr:tetratricopeptide repeat protein [Chloroflexota bacterium]
MQQLPTGTVTFLFTDIEGSTTRWENYPEAMRIAVAQHDRLFYSLMEAHGGIIFKTVGDAFYVVFITATKALAAAIAAQRALAKEIWPQEVGSLRVRMAIHTGVAEQRGNDYFGQPLNRVARILSAGHGGQLLLSLIAQKLVQDNLPEGVALSDLGEHRLKDIQHAEHIFQATIMDLPFTFPALKTLDCQPNNLPTQMTPFIGRQRELKAIVKLFLQEKVRLLTLIGPGGTGKTRLGLQVAAEVADYFPKGVFFIELAISHDTDSVLTAISQVLGIRETGNKPLIERLKDTLNGQVLLLLDNFEQVIEASPLIMHLLVSCPELKVLVTSRAALALTGEQEYHVGPLTLPDSKFHSDLVELEQYESIALFVQQAKAAKPDFQLNQANALAIIEICKRLDGLPLAIELAAARAKLLPPQALLKRLEHHLRLLKDEKRDRTERQQTLRGAIAWSYDLLNDDEKTMFAQLAIFTGGCMLDAIEEVCLGEDIASDPLDLLTSLIDKSLLRQHEQENGEPRFGMLHTIRDFALEQLAETGNEETLHRRHFDYYLRCAEEAAPALTGIEQRYWLERLEYEHDNLLAALWWGSTQAEVETGSRLAGALWRFWLMRGYLHEGRHWLEKFLDAAGTDIARLRLLEGASILACRQKDYERAETLADEALVLSRVLGNQEAIASASTTLAEIAHVRGENEHATALFEESLKIQRVLGNIRGTASLLNNLGKVALQHEQPQRAMALFEESLMLLRKVGDELAQATVLNNLGEIERRCGNSERAYSLYEESLLLSRKLKYIWGIAASLTNLAATARHQGDYQHALDHYKESLTLFHEMGDIFGVALCFEGLAEIAYALNQPEHATRLIAVAELLRQAIVATTLQFDPAAHINTINALRSALGSDTFEIMWRTGQTRSIDQAIADALIIEISSH